VGARSGRVVGSWDGENMAGRRTPDDTPCTIVGLESHSQPCRTSAKHHVSREGGLR